MGLAASVFRLHKLRSYQPADAVVVQMLLCITNLAWGTCRSWDVVQLCRELPHKVSGHVMSHLLPLLSRAS